MTQQTDFRALCAELVQIADVLDGKSPSVANQGQPLDGFAALANFRQVAARARAALAEPVAEGPTAEGELVELVEWLRETGDLIQPSHLAEHQRYKRAADLLEQRQPAPVPVNERLPEPGDCDAEVR